MRGLDGLFLYQCSLGVLISAAMKRGTVEEVDVLPDYFRTQNYRSDLLLLIPMCPFLLVLVLDSPFCLVISSLLLCP